MGAPQQFHSLSEARSWALHCAVAERLRREPDLIEGPRARVLSWLSDPAAHPYARAWNELLNCSGEELLIALVKNDETMCTLRQASPFAGILSSKERWNILKQS